MPPVVSVTISPEASGVLIQSKFPIYIDRTEVYTNPSMANDDGLLPTTSLPPTVAVQQLRDSNTALTSLRVDGDITDAGAGELVAAAADSVTRHTLRSLVLLNKGLTAVPSGVQRLFDLEELDLADNAIPRVPVEVGSLDVLRVLILDHNQLEAVPAELGNLTDLMQLVLANNRLTTLPATFTKLTSLSDLNLAGAVVLLRLRRWRC